MKSVIIGCCLIAVAFGIPAPAPDYSKPKEASYGHPTGGYQSQDSYNKAPAKQVCETHYKTIYKLVFEDKVVKKCEDVPEKVCKYIKEKVCHQEEGYGGDKGYNSQYHHKPEVCHYEDHKKCMEDHKEVCHYDSIRIPKNEPKKVPEKVCRYEKHHSYSRKWFWSKYE